MPNNKYKIPRIVPDELKKILADAKPEIIQIADYRIWCLYNPEILFANSMIVEGKDGIIVIDTGISKKAGEYIKEHIQELTDKPLTTIIYTHHHYDHINGTGALVSQEQLDNGEVKIYAAENFIEEHTAENIAIAPIMTTRASYGYGQHLEKEDLDDFLIGGMMAKPCFGTGVFIRPNVFLVEKQDLEIQGMKMHIFQTGGEAATEIVIYLPELKVLFCADEVYPSNPNLHSLRGTKPRNANKWIEAIDKMRNLDVEYLVGSHGKPVIGKEKIEEILLYYRDIIQYQHDQAIRYINKGYTYKNLAEQLSKLPAYLEYPPYSTNYYGHIKHNVPEFFSEYISWFAGDPLDLAPTPAIEKATRYVKLMGGKDMILNEAEKSYMNGDFQFAAELVSLLITMDGQNTDAKQLKAASFRQLGYQQINSWWRGWYLTCALELEEKIDVVEITNKRQEIMRSIEFVSALSLEQIYSRFRYCVNPAEAQNKHIIVGMIFEDTKEQFSLELRHSVLIHSDDIPNDADAVISMTRELLNKIIMKKETFLSAIVKRKIQIKGKKMKLQEFFKCLDLDLEPVYLAK